MEHTREKPCDCWLNLDHCPVNCEEKRNHLKAFNTEIHCFGEMRTPLEAKEMEVEYIEL
jgi:hypothetical protein